VKHKNRGERKKKEGKEVKEKNKRKKKKKYVATDVALLNNF
jgi:hypothetical protein